MVPALVYTASSDARDVIYAFASIVGPARRIVSDYSRTVERLLQEIILKDKIDRS